MDSLPSLDYSVLQPPPGMGHITTAASSDMTIGTTLAVCLLLALPVMAIGRRTLGPRLRACIAPAGSHAATEALAIISPSSERLRTALMLAVTAIAMMTLRLTTSTLAPCLRPGVALWQLVAVGSTGVLAVLLLQRQAYSWIHATFFSPQHAPRWESAWHLTTRLTAVVMLFCALLSTCSFVPANLLAAMAVLALFVVKTPLLQCAWSSFFGTNASYFHFFAYLCALETIPLFAAWRLTALIARAYIL